MNSKLLTATTALLLLAAATPVREANAQTGNEMFTNAYKVPPDFLATAGAQGQTSARNVLTAAGISFPPGSSAVFNSATSQLIARNTLPNLQAIETFVGSLLKKSPTPTGLAELPDNVPINITVSTQSYEVSKTDPLVAQVQDPKADAKAMLQKLAGLAGRGLARVAALPAVTTRSGQRSLARSGDVSLEAETVISAARNQIYLQATFGHGGQSLPIKTTLPLGGAAYMGMLDNAGKKGNVELVFISVSAQLAGSAPLVSSSLSDSKNVGGTPAAPSNGEAKTAVQPIETKTSQPAATSEVSKTATPPMDGMDALALVDPAKHSQEKAVWSRTASGIEWQANGAPAPYAGTFRLPVELASSYAVEVEFTCGAPKVNVGITIPVGDKHVTTCWFSSNGFAGIGKIDGVDPKEISIPGTASRFAMKPGERYTARAEVRRAPEGVDVQFLVAGKNLAAYRGTTARLTHSAMWRLGGERSFVLLGASNSATFHRATVKAVDDLPAGDKATPPTPTPASPTPPAVKP